AAVPPATTPLLGADKVGRVAFYKHFRPPGLPITIPPGLTLFSDVNIMKGITAPPPAPAPQPIWFPYKPTTPRSNFWLFDIWNPASADRSITPPGPLPSARTVTLLPGYEAQRTQNLPTPPLSPTLVAGMPSNDPTPPVEADTTLPQPAVPTFDQYINTIQG